MKHSEQCEKCGKEYNPDVTDTPEEIPKCAACGAEIYPSNASSRQTSEDDEEHLVEKGLRKVTDGITGNKR